MKANVSPSAGLGMIVNLIPENIEDQKVIRRIAAGLNIPGFIDKRKQSRLTGRRQAPVTFYQAMRVTTRFLDIDRFVDRGLPELPPNGLTVVIVEI